MLESIPAVASPQESGQPVHRREGLSADAPASLPTFSIVTPSFNRLQFFPETIASVVLQRGDFNVEYVIADGGSEPCVLDFLRRQTDFVDSLTTANALRPVELRWFSAPDDGMYDAINRGFADTRGEIMAWINTDDIYLPGAFQAVSEIFQAFPEIEWIAGIPAICNRSSTIVHLRDVFTRYNQSSIAFGFHHRCNRRFGYNWIQQDCVFWRRRLWFAAGGFGPDPWRYAGDWHLWRRFARHAPLVKVQAVLSAFREHGAQITASRHLYEGEVPPPPRPSLGLLLHNQALALSQQYPLLLRVPAIARRTMRGALRALFRLDPAFLESSYVDWAPRTGSWQWHK